MKRLVIERHWHNRIIHKRQTILAFVCDMLKSCSIQDEEAFARASPDLFLDPLQGDVFRTADPHRECRVVIH